MSEEDKAIMKQWEDYKTNEVKVLATSNREDSIFLLLPLKKRKRRNNYRYTTKNQMCYVQSRILRSYAQISLT